MPTFSYLSAASLLLAAASAQTWTTCNPLNSTCGKDSALGTTLDITSFPSTPKSFAEQSTGIAYKNNVATFTISKKGQAPTIVSDFYIFFGSVEVILQASPGTGIVSSVVLESDDLDEIDWEWIGGNAGAVETNYFGKGNTTTYNRATWPTVSSPPQTNYHNYTLTWTADAINWIVDTKVVRTLAYADANGGSNYPQTPMKLRIGSWAGGDSSEPKGTIEWAGGVVDYSKGPFTMNVKSLKVTDGSDGSAYEYGDETGSWKSIKVLKGDSGASSGSTTASSSAADKTDAAKASQAAVGAGANATGSTAAASASSSGSSAAASAFASSSSAINNAGAANRVGGAALVSGLFALAMFAL